MPVWSGENRHPGHRALVSACGGKGWDLSGASLRRALIPFMSSPPS